MVPVRVGNGGGDMSDEAVPGFLGRSYTDKRFLEARQVSPTYWRSR
jgi:hypothetical protein